MIKYIYLAAFITNTMAVIFAIFLNVLNVFHVINLFFAVYFAKAYLRESDGLE